MFYLITVRCLQCDEDTEFLVPHPTEIPVVCRRCKYPLANIEEVRGFVYVLSNPGIPGLVKIGFTESTVDERVQQLSSSTSIPHPFTVEAYFLSTDPQRDERCVHKRLGDFRKPGREFFAITAETAISEIKAEIGREPQFIRTRPLTEHRC